MVGYKIYLTRSHEVALLLSEANRVYLGKDNLYSTSSGSVNRDCRVPSLYHDKGYFYCILEYRDLETPKYELVFA